MSEVAIIRAKEFLNDLLKKNHEFAENFKKNLLMQVVNSNQMDDPTKRRRLLDSIQTFSDYFQKAVMLRYIFCDNQKFFPVIQEHLKEEFGHNFQLMLDRGNKPSRWDAILDASTAWFSWKMMALDQEEKTVLMHLVLETSAVIFFKQAHIVMQSYGDTNYFETHAEADEEHQKMGIDLLQGLTLGKYESLLEVQQKGWEMLNTVCERIAYLACQAS